VPGNHDRIFSGEKDAKIERFLPVYEDVFDDILTEEALYELSDGTVVRLCHFPYVGDSHENDRYADKRPVDTGVVLLHGHTHSSNRVSRSKKGTLQIHVGVDAWKLLPGV